MQCRIFREFNVSEMFILCHGDEGSGEAILKNKEGNKEGVPSNRLKHQQLGPNGPTDVVDARCFAHKCVLFPAPGNHDIS